ncbi:uncharacterized protein MONOS_17138 [Monocercomonoides exilis]|uniref:uncharacterized protein n=1 Tax=Monocercomonoides exilis TaxID=2049356 RepID=UPI00355ABD49|nr:hypothetical protein MONOS_17138 [Monocercomonoides exilis]
MWVSGFEYSSLNKRFEKMIIVEEEKKEEKDERLSTDLCECYLLLTCRPSYEFISASCILCILKVASRKDETEEVQKDVEIALLALSNIELSEGLKELYLNEIKEIIQYHQEHHNLAQLAYQSAWEFLMSRHYEYHDLEGVIENELCFAREAKRELEELTRSVDWKKKEEEMSKEESKKVMIIRRWLSTIFFFLSLYQERNEESVGLIGRIVQVFRAARENNKEISNWCIYYFREAAVIVAVEIEDLLNSGAIEIEKKDG